MPTAADLLRAALAHGVSDTGKLTAALMEALDLLSIETGQNKYRHASSVMRGAVGGAPPIDDDDALDRIGAFPATRRREAVGIVARQLAGAGGGDERVDAISHRLRRKLREKETDTSVMSVSPAL